MTEPTDWYEEKKGGYVSRVPEGKRGLGVGAQPVTLGDKRATFVIPVMDKDEVVQRTPHGGRPMKLIELEGVNYNDFRLVLSGAYLSYIGGVSGDEKTRGAPPTHTDVAKQIDMNPEKIKRIMAMPAFREAAEARGIAMSKRPGITAAQDLALSIILDPTAGIGLAARLKKAGVPMSRYRAWMRNPTFRGYVETLGGGVLKEFENDMLTSLAGLAVDGDREAIKFAFEMTGKHNPKQQDVMNVREVMLQIMNIIQRHVTDPETLQKVGSEIMMLAGAAGVSDAKPVEQPKEITDA